MRVAEGFAGHVGRHFPPRAIAGVRAPPPVARRKRGAGGRRGGDGRPNAPAQTRAGRGCWPARRTARAVYACAGTCARWTRAAVRAWR